MEKISIKTDETSTEEVNAEQLDIFQMVLNVEHLMIK